MKKIIATIFTLFVLSFITGCSENNVNESAEKVRIIYLPTVQALPLYVAVEKGFFEDVGIEVDVKRIEAPNLIIDALLADNADMAMSAAAGITAISEYKNPGKLNIFSVMGDDEENVNYVLYGRSDSGIKTIGDIQGKKLGIIPGIQFRTIATHVLKKNGVDMEGIALVDLAPSVQVAALASGQIDALLTLEPMGIIISREGIGYQIERAPLVRYISDPFYGGLGVVTTEFVKNNPELAQKTIDALKKSEEYIRDYPEEARMYLVGYTNLPAELTDLVPFPIFKEYRAFDANDIAALQTFADVFFEEGVIDGRAKVEEMIYKSAP